VLPSALGDVGRDLMRALRPLLRVLGNFLRSGTFSSTALATADDIQKQLDRFADLPDRGDRTRLSPAG
jgi:hypothetical protein